ncbi:MAG: methionyl-tRNA formyltransferase [Clostridia bacterium]|nr:methionyl-tRNA formyltransferase [Clostridia bacterium]
MKIVFMGTPDFAAISLEKLISRGHEVGLVITQPDKAKDRGKKVKFSPVKEVALEHNIPVLQPEKVKNNQQFFDVLKEYNPDIIVVAAYGKIIPKEILELPRYGCINVHASLLPRLRGASPIQHAIVDGEKVTGVTIMQMGQGLDTGDMLTKTEVEIGDMNYEELHDVLSVKGADLLVETLSLIEQGKVKPEKQDDSLSTYAPMIYKQDGKIDFGKSPEEIERLVRGFDPWPGAFCNYGDMTLKIWHCSKVMEETKEENGTILDVSDRGILISCGGKKLLADEIQVPGKKRVMVKDYIRGNSLERGKVLE